MTFSRILTHPGGSHKDEFLACCLLLAENPVTIVRREPTEADLTTLMPQDLLASRVFGHQESTE